MLLAEKRQETHAAFPKARGFNPDHGTVVLFSLIRLRSLWCPHFDTSDDVGVDGKRGFWQVQSDADISDIKKARRVQRHLLRLREQLPCATVQGCAMVQVGTSPWEHRSHANCCNLLP